MAYCNQCGTQVNEGARFCENCGVGINVNTNLQNNSSINPSNAAYFSDGERHVNKEVKYNTYVSNGQGSEPKSNGIFKSRPASEQTNQAGAYGGQAKNYIPRSVTNNNNTQAQQTQGHNSNTQAQQAQGYNNNNTQAQQYQVNNEQQTANTTFQTNQNNNSSSERKIIYEGSVYKCPNCGEIINAFDTTCSSCGYELRGRKSINSVMEFNRQLGLIASKSIPTTSHKSSIMKSLFGKDFKDEDEEQRKFDSQKEEEMASFIINYPIPNVKEDIIEFMMLIISQLKYKKIDVENKVNKAWVLKMEQVYEKAKFLLPPNDDEFIYIKNTYEQNMKVVTKRKMISRYLYFILICAMLLIFAIINALTIMLTVLIIVLIVAGVIGFVYYKKGRKDK